MNSTRKGVEFNSAFQRRFFEPPLQELKIDQKLKVRGGFNVFDKKDDDFRTYYGYGEEVEIEIVDSTNDYARTIACSMLILATAFSLIAF